MSIEVDPTVLENPEDEDYLSAGYDTSTASLSSSVHEYLFEHGRRYHAYYGTDKYLIPTDEKEQDRLDLHHESLRLIWNEKLHEAHLMNLIKSWISVLVREFGLSIWRKNTLWRRSLERISAPYSLPGYLVTADLRWTML
ncbi:Similar to hypothetical protein HMPREF1120_01429 [Exophiala dermatitidis NIH/UT8656]; acc. no. EHY53232 [Pyronema omphalodes CBS 100304]|uniref:Uncharacterized protein n=1 Tax=Pyronema omphalodes (strain CBS 100304) TaxID=1076935 RepID=U4L179_PYROM|nr:Similar to hypothetical protein HMPREF1120_01429 [Exophiala dermatitidis NIH/UT8656]; acc. no. EHY53232 [Pyronema omphalodes CBS 100304]